MRKAVFDESSHPLGHEIAQEAASNLGRLGRALERALADLRAFDERRRAVEAASTADARADARARQALVKRAATALWHYVVQRESIGLRDTERMMRDYAVPADVRHRMGIVGGD